mgnify:CR=1 FL=1
MDARGRVLVVEDDEDSRELLVRALQGADIKVSSATDGVEGLERMAEETPALIFLDLMMPRMDGFTFLRHIRETPQWKSVPVVVLTAMALTRAQREELQSLGSELLRKGTHGLDEILLAVRKLTQPPVVTGGT